MKREGSYLAVAGHPQRRDALATLLWPDYGQNDARKALRRDLSELHLALGGQWLEADRERVGLRPGFWLDVAQFQRHLDECTSTPASCSTQLVEAVGLYRDDFLTGFTLSDAPAFDDWQSFHTETLRLACGTVLERLAQLLADQGNSEAAIAHVRRRLTLDELHEPAHRQLMQLYAQTGQQAAALHQYERCCKLLDKALGVPPAPETTLLYEQIRARQVVQTPVAVVRTTPAPPPAVVRSPRHNLPVQSTPFFGREQELADIRRLLLAEPDCRLLNLFGPGGIGKTRLALAAATQTLDAFADGVFFVSLAPVSEAAYIVPAIAEALRFTFYGQSDPKTQLLDYLSQKRLLLIVDNLEHLYPGADLLADIVSQAPGVTLLTTSRERLHLQEEWVYEVQGLPFPAAGGKATANVDAYPSVRLFLQRARQSQATFAPMSGDLTEIGRICQLVEGMPLGLELAAPWIRTLSCRELAAEIEHSLDFLTTPLRNAPERHRSLRVVFEQTWGRLSQAEQAVLMRLSVFRGGCTREAAEAVAGATLPLLSSLVDKALVRRTNLGRYELHELIRQFAEAQLQITPYSVEQTRQRHQEYFITFLERRTAGVKGGRQKDTVAEIKADMDNVRLAWRRAVAKWDALAIERAAECLFVFYLYSNGHYEGQAAFQQAATAFLVDPDPLTEDGSPGELVVWDRQENLAGFLLAGQGYFLGRTVEQQRGQALLEDALTLLRRAATIDRRKEGFALLWLGWIVYLQGRPATVLQEYVAPTLAVVTETGDRWAEGWGLLLWANTLCSVSPLEAEEICARGSTVCRESGDQNNLGYTHQMRSGANMSLGHFAQAKQYTDEAIHTFEEMGNVLGLGYALLRQGELSIALGEYGQAIQCLQRAKANFSEVRTEHDIIWAQFELARVLRLDGKYDQAELLLRQSFEVSTALNNRGHLAACLLGLGCLAYDQDRLNEAEEYLQQALAQSQQLGLELWVADVLRHLALVMITSGQYRYAEARETFRQALELAIKHQLAPTALDIFVGVARLRALAGAPEQAIDLLTLAAQHEASTFATRQQARQFLAEQTGHLRPEASQPFQAHGVQLDWQQPARQLVEELLAELAGNGTSSALESHQLAWLHGPS
jgi:predicted ATPase/DNA-binding SARP family transcriptional activator